MGGGRVLGCFKIISRNMVFESELFSPKNVRGNFQKRREIKPSQKILSENLLSANSV